ncbi:hypothetical protein P7C73_g4671, partial [Tremellales sp. Uapishka_1]
MSLAMDDIVVFASQNPPPPYEPVPPAAPQNRGGRQGQAGNVPYDLSPMSHEENRPSLPEEFRNPYLSNLPEDVTIVKFQTIVREGREIVVGRLKVPTGGGAHAFILRRYDTNAISLTTMFKVAFPGAPEADEKSEMMWVKSSFDTRHVNGGPRSPVVRLAGQWGSRHLAIHLAPSYNLAELVAALARAVPDPHVVYRRSQRSQAAADELVRSGGQVAAPVPSLTAGSASPAPKRQRHRGRGDSAEQDSRRLTLEATTTVTAPTGTQIDMEQEIRAAKQLVTDLKRELRLRAAAGEDLEDQGVLVQGEGSRGIKRGKGGDEAVSISGGASKDNRMVRGNKRIDESPVAQGAKKAAWGALIFGLGVGAATLLPQFASSFF